MMRGWFTRRRKCGLDRRRRRTLGKIEPLEARLPLDAKIIISEVMAVNDDSIADEDGDYPDWFELLNISDETVDLNGWHVTDDPDDLNQWSLPQVQLIPGQHLVLFASGKDRDNPTRPLHTDFKLSGGGEYLALTRPDETIEFEFDPQFPAQVEDVSYGVPNQLTRSTLVDVGADAQVFVPTDSSLDPADLANNQIEGSWVDPSFDDNSWSSAKLGIGYWDEANDSNPRPGDGTVVGSSVDEFSRNQNRDGWRYGYWNKTSDDDDVYDPAKDFDAFVWSGLSRVTANNHWDGTKWDLAVDPDTPNTEMSDVGAHPNGSNSGDVHHAVRRWTSDVDGSVLIHGRLENASASGDGVIARVLVGGNEVYQRQLNGFGVDYAFVAAVNDGDKVDFVIDPGASQNDVGDATEFSVTIEDVTALVDQQGGNPTLGDEIVTDIESQMKGVGSSAYLRVPFVPDTADFDSLALSIKYDDAFVAYLNGRPIASAGGPQAVDAVWSSTALNDRDDAESLEFERFNVSDALDSLIADVENVLMIHVMNHSSADDDLLLVPQLVGTRLEVNSADRRYFVTPSPGEANGLGDTTVGPLFVDHQHQPEQPRANEPIIVTADVAESFHSVARVSLKYRVMYQSERTLSMVDDGSGDDAVAGDGIYTATIPGGIAEAGEMIRWYMSATDSQQLASRFPRYEDPQDSEQYFGTVVVDPAVTSNLPVLHWFARNRNSAFTRSGTQGSLFYDGEFYDNVTFDLHGQSSSGFPTTKKSMDVDFPRDHRFRWQDDIPRMKDFNLLTNFADKSKLRNTLGYEQRAFIGDGYHLAEPVRVQYNGDFFAVYDFVEDGDDRWLERLGLDPEGALYKMYNRLDRAQGEKKTRKDENIADLTELVNGINLRGDELEAFVMDNIDVAAMANYLAGFVVTSNVDCCHKNYYLYRDTNASGEWRFLPWDVDLSQGRVWGGFGLAYFDDTMYPNRGMYMGRNNRLIDVLYEIPEFEEMYLRRVRTVIDAYVKPPGTPYEELPLETRVDELVQMMAADAALDNQMHRATWGQTGFQTFQEANGILKNEYSTPRREFLYETQVAPDTSHLEVFVSGTPGDTLARYLVPSNNSLGTSWTALGFDDQSWKEGETGIGFEKSPPGYDNLLRTDLSNEMDDRTSVYMRIPFQLDSLNGLDDLTLRVKYDDGFIAYLNGTEVARAGVSNAAPTYNMTSQNHSDNQAVVFQDFDVSSFANRLRIGENVLAIQAVNSSAGSSDFLMLPELVDGKISSGNGPIPGAQVGNPKIDIGSIDFNPVSGNQDEEFIELVNNNSFAVDVSGWQLADAVDMTLRPGTVIPAGSSLYLTPSASAFRARATGPSGGQKLFVQGDYDGHLSNFGETISLQGADGQLVSSLNYTGLPTDVQQHLRVSEIMYNPLPPDEAESAQNAGWNESDMEFIELRNTSTQLTLDLSGVAFTDGISFNFDDGRINQLGPQERVLVVANETAFLARYGDSVADRIAGEFSLASGLRDSGETIKLEDASNSTVLDFQYSDDADRGWPRRADGQGSSMQIVDAGADYSDPDNWIPSSRIHGTPAVGPDSLDSALVINEILTRSEPPALDAIELFNAGDQSIQLDHYFLSDSARDLDALGRFEIPATLMAAGNYLVLTENDFNVDPNDPNGFALSSTRGESLFLTLGDQTGPTHFVDTVRFPASAPDESFGRVPNGTGPLAPMRSINIGSENQSARVGPVIISEVHYHPADPSDAALAIDPELKDDDLEFVEIHNSSGESIDLTNWRIRGNVDYDFDDGQIIRAGETLLVVSFNPSRPDNAARIQAFMVQYGLPQQTRVLGGYSGQLDNGGHRITLQRPGAPPQDEPGFIPRLWEDEIQFRDSSPWPVSADGQGDSLQRTHAAAFGLMTDSWRAASPTPAQVELTSAPADFNGDGLLDIQDIDYFASQFRRATPDPAVDLTRDGTVDNTDRNRLLAEFGTTYGDSNLDRVFNSTDLIVVFTAGEYEDGIDGNSNWTDGDWNLDGDFTTSDLIVAFAAGGYSAGVRPAPAEGEPDPPGQVEQRIAAAIEFDIIDGDLPAPEDRSADDDSENPLLNVAYAWTAAEPTFSAQRVSLYDAHLSHLNDPTDQESSDRLQAVLVVDGQMVNHVGDDGLPPGTE